MSLQNFLNNTCNVYEIVKELQGGEYTKTKEMIYDNIKCYYYKSNAKLDDTGLAENTTLYSYKLILEPNYNLVRTGMHIDLYDNDLGYIGEYIINSVKMNRLINGNNDSIELVIKKI